MPTPWTHSPWRPAMLAMKGLLPRPHSHPFSLPHHGTTATLYDDDHHHQPQQKKQQQHRPLAHSLLHVNIVGSHPRPSHCFCQLHHDHDHDHHYPKRKQPPRPSLAPVRCYASSSKQWVERQGRDRFNKAAHVMGLKSRAAFKLLELDAKHRLFCPGQVVVDLGYAPGSWSQVAVERTRWRGGGTHGHHQQQHSAQPAGPSTSVSGSKGAPPLPPSSSSQPSSPSSSSSSPPARNGPSYRDGIVVGIDVIPAQPPKGVSTIQGNFLSAAVRGLTKRFLADAVLRRAEIGTAQRAQERERKAALRRTQKEEAAAVKAHQQRQPQQQGSVEKKEDEGEGEEAEDNNVIVQERPSYIDLERRSALEKEAGDEEDGGRDEGTVVAGMDPGALKKSLLVDIVLSDMSEPWPQTAGYYVNSMSNPHFRMMNTSGNTFRDHAGSMDLCLAALLFASDALRAGGHFVCKFYQGCEDKDLERRLKMMFRHVHREKPEASKSESKEGYFVALERKAGVTFEDTEPNQAQAKKPGQAGRGR